MAAARVGHELVVSASPGPPSAMCADRSAGVRDGTEVFALGGFTETLAAIFLRHVSPMRTTQQTLDKSAFDAVDGSSTGT